MRHALPVQLGILVFTLVGTCSGAGGESSAEAWLGGGMPDGAPLDPKRGLDLPSDISGDHPQWGKAGDPYGHINHKSTGETADAIRLQAQLSGINKVIHDHMGGFDPAQVPTPPITTSEEATATSTTIPSTTTSVVSEGNAASDTATTPTGA